MKYMVYFVKVAEKNIRSVHKKIFLNQQKMQQEPLMAFIQNTHNETNLRVRFDSTLKSNRFERCFGPRHKIQ